MSLDQFDFQARTVIELQSFFQDIVNHLDSQNYENSTTWVPSITGLTGTNTITSFYQRFGKEISFTVKIVGDSTTVSAHISNLPFTAIEYGIIAVFNVTDNALIDHSYIDINTVKGYLPDWSLSSKTIIIQGDYIITGI